ncbi:predicted protein [Nematostella vectensis]|uniref:Uncharacterized protein n=1 Tax=Nematostella vectensis TaxID=45351 RepID=A7SQI9_NEMVE|nr:uncharacterized protein LOC5505288 [Nematostella vectensis]EDO34032.1 predicted protein [Nematostella vectensis]|eukprot:XP_001626132.1 predicted protein [Nematostella vectensis]
MKAALWIAVFLCVALSTVVSIECKYCWPAMDREKCRASEKTINCREYKSMDYNSCIEVIYHGNHTIARTCYQGLKCGDARIDCMLQGPCEVKCCQKNFCNTAGKSSVSYALMATITSLSAYLSLA